jgi:heme A synthase
MSRTLSMDRLALFAVAATLALMTLGSVVHGTGSSLACPDWPLCHGSALPAMSGGVRFEHSHRLAALAVVAMTVALAFAVWRRGHPAERRLATTACVLLAVQATLGALTVLLRLPPAISVAHLATSMAFLAVLVALTAHLTGARAGTDRAARAVFTIATGIAYVQVVLGAVVRHTGAALVCPGLPLCAGAVWPDGLLPRLQMVHRVVAGLAFSAVLLSAAVCWKARRPRLPRAALMLAPLVLVLGQIALGIAIVTTGTPLPLVTAHHATGALLLASLVLARSTC